MEGRQAEPGRARDRLRQGPPSPADGDDQLARVAGDVQPHRHAGAGGVLGDVGEGLLQDAVEAERGRRRDLVEVAVRVVGHRDPGPAVVGDQRGHVPQVGGRRAHRLVRAAEEPDGAPDVRHRPSTHPLGVAQRGHRVVQSGRTVLGGLLHLAAGRGQVQHRDAQGVGDQVVHLAGDPLPLLEDGLPLPHGVVACLGLDPQLLGPHDVAEVEADEDPHPPDRDLGPGQVTLQPGQHDHRLAGDQHHDPAPQPGHAGDVAGHHDEQSRDALVLDRVGEHQGGDGTTGQHDERRPGAAHRPDLQDPGRQRHEGQGRRGQQVVRTLRDRDRGREERRGVDQRRDPQRVVGEPPRHPAPLPPQHETRDVHPTRVGPDDPMHIRPWSETAGRRPTLVGCARPDCRRQTGGPVAS